VTSDIQGLGIATLRHRHPKQLRAGSVRQIPELDDAEASRVIEAALEQARQLAIKVYAALADSGAHLKVDVG
jgi:hypothetical protein